MPYPDKGSSPQGALEGSNETKQRGHCGKLVEHIVEHPTETAEIVAVSAVVFGFLGWLFGRSNSVIINNNCQNNKFKDIDIN